MNTNELEEIKQMFRENEKRQNREALIGNVITKIWPIIDNYRELGIKSIPRVYRDLQKQIAEMLKDYLDENKIPDLLWGKRNEHR
jgi:hypothetical protein